jgi:hypothetical protein
MAALVLKRIKTGANPKEHERITKRGCDSIVGALDAVSVGTLNPQAYSSPESVPDDAQTLPIV